jgi:hypothetical protein
VKPKDIDIEQMQRIVDKSIECGQTDLVVQILAQAYQDYIDIAYICTDGNYTDSWTHKQVMSYFTTEGNL